MKFYRPTRFTAISLVMIGIATALSGCNNPETTTNPTYTGYIPPFPGQFPGTLPPTDPQFCGTGGLATPQGCQPGGGGNYVGPLYFQGALRVDESGRSIFKNFLKEELQACDQYWLNWGAYGCNAYSQTAHVAIELPSPTLSTGTYARLTVSGTNFQYGSPTRSVDTVVRPINGNQGFMLYQTNGYSYLSAQITRVAQDWRSMDVTLYYKKRPFSAGRIHLTH